MVPAPRHFIMRLTREGPLVPARLQWLDHEPGAPDNELDRGRLSPFPYVDIAGAETDPDVLLDRLGFRRRGDAGSLPHEVLAAFANAALVPRPVGHWAYAQPVSEDEYDFQFRRMRWAENNRPNDPVLKPQRKVDPAQLPLPNFDRENAL